MRSENGVVNLIKLGKKAEKFKVKPTKIWRKFAFIAKFKCPFCP